MNWSIEATLSVLGIAIAIAIGIWQISLAQKQIVVSQKENTEKELSIIEAYHHFQLSLLLDKVKNFWLAGVLEKSLLNSYELNLDKEIRYDLVEDPWNDLRRPPSNKTVNPKSKISDIFEQNDRTILILGESGSGKTITLLKLAQELITRIEKNKNGKIPVPVIFNLSSWAGQSIDKWMVAELNRKYRVPKFLGHRWIEMGWLVPLVDGLDEVAIENRLFCVEAINEYCNDFGLAGIAICCRLEAYLNIPTPLKVSAAICLQPLTRRHINQYIKEVCPKDSFLRTLFSEDPNMFNVATSPLILSLLVLSYQSVRGGINKTSSIAPDFNKFRESFFGFYIDGMLQNKRTSSELFTSENAK